MFGGLFSRFKGRGGDQGSSGASGLPQPASAEKPNKKKWGRFGTGGSGENGGQTTISDPIPSSFPLSLTGMDDHAGVWNPHPTSSSHQGAAPTSSAPPRQNNITWLNSDDDLVEQFGGHGSMVSLPPTALVRGTLAPLGSSSSSLPLADTQFTSASHLSAPSLASTSSGSSITTLAPPNKMGLKLQTGSSGFTATSSSSSSSSLPSSSQDILNHYSALYPASLGRQKLSPIAEQEYTSPDSAKGPRTLPSDSSLSHATGNPNRAGTPQSVAQSHSLPGNPSPSPSSSQQSEIPRPAGPNLFITRALNRTISQTSSRTQVSVTTTSSQTRINVSTNVSSSVGTGPASATPPVSAVSGVGMNSPLNPSANPGPQLRPPRRNSNSSEASTVTIPAPAAPVRSGSPVPEHSQQSPTAPNVAAQAYSQSYHAFPHNYPYSGPAGAILSGPQLSTITDVTEAGYRGSFASAASGGSSSGGQISPVDRRSGSVADRMSGSPGDRRSGSVAFPTIVGGVGASQRYSGSRKGSGDRTSGSVTGYDGETTSLHADSFVTASDASLGTGRGSRPARRGVHSDFEPETPIDDGNAGSIRSTRRVRIEGDPDVPTDTEHDGVRGDDEAEDDRDNSPGTSDDSPLSRQRFPILFGNSEGDISELGYAFPMPPHRSFENLPQSIGHQRHQTMSSSTSTATPIRTGHHHSSSSETATTPKNVPSSPIPIPTRNSQPTPPTPEIPGQVGEPIRHSAPGAILTDPITLEKGKEASGSRPRRESDSRKLRSPPSASESFISRRWNRDASIPTDRFIPSTFRIRKARPWANTTPAFWAFWIGFMCPVLWLIGGWHFTNFGEQPPRLTFWEFYFNAGYWKEIFSTCCGVRKKSKGKDLEMMMPPENLTLGGPALGYGGPIHEEPGEVEKQPEQQPQNGNANDPKGKGKGKEVIQVKDSKGKRKTEEDLPLPAWVAEKQKTPDRRARLYDPKRSLRGISFGYPFIPRPVHLEEDYNPDSEHWFRRAFTRLTTVLGKPNRLFDQLYGVKLTHVRGRKECTRRVFDPWIQRCRYAFCYALVMVCIGLLTATVYLIIYNTRQLR
ncbi:hypothetical protein AX16_006772 [Volvariella volvacea WC 439]|nr:hypothetical protein AX16_006772 [Volvariella volvacea WC 439]